MGQFMSHWDMNKRGIQELNLSRLTLKRESYH